VLDRVDVAAAAGVVRRTVDGHFPTRTDLVRDLTRAAVGEMADADAPDEAADAVWADVVARLWPLAHRHRVLLALRRSEHGDEMRRARRCRPRRRRR